MKSRRLVLLSFSSVEAGDRPFLKKSVKKVTPSTAAGWFTVAVVRSAETMSPPAIQMKGSEEVSVLPTSPPPVIA